MNTFQFWAILVAILGVFVTLLKFNRNTITKEDLTSALNSAIEALRLDMNKRFEEVDRRFEEAVGDREKIRREMSEGFADARVERQAIRDDARVERQAIKEEAAGDREKIRREMGEGFAGARVERKEIEDEARDDRKEIKREIIRQNQNYIEHLAHHGTQKANPVSEEDDST